MGDKRNVVETDNSNRVSDRKNLKNKLESKNITLTPEKDQSKMTVLSSSIDDKDKSIKSEDSFKKNITKEMVTAVKLVEEKSAEKYNVLEINKSSKGKIIPEVVDLDDSIEGSDIYKAMEPLPKEKTISE